MKVELVRSIDESRWARLLESCSHRSPFHHEGWARVLATSDTALDAFWLLATASDGSYLGGLPLIRQRPRLAYLSAAEQRFSENLLQSASDSSYSFIRRL